MTKRKITRKKPVRKGGARTESLADIVTTKLDITSMTNVKGWLSTGSTWLDWAISGKVRGGGIPVQRLTECYGDTSTGKTALAMQLAIEAQRKEWDVVFYDTEAAMSRTLFETLGGDLDNLVYRAPDTINELFGDIERIFAAREKHKRISTPVLIVWDSIAASSTRTELDAAIEDNTPMALHARQISMAMRKLARDFYRQNAALFFTNQTRKRIGSFYGSDVTTFGGMAVGFYSSVRVQLRMIGKLGDKEAPSGITVRANVKKNKVSKPFRVADFDIVFDEGINDASSVYYMLKKLDLIVVRGSWSRCTIPGVEGQFQKRTWHKTYKKYEKQILAVLRGM